MSTDPLDTVANKALEYRRVARITGAGQYPPDNRCGTCARVSDHPLIPWKRRWKCTTCTYGEDYTPPARVATQPRHAIREAA